MRYHNILLDVPGAPCASDLRSARALLTAGAGPTPVERVRPREHARAIVREVVRCEHDLVITPMRGRALRDLLRTCPCAVWVLSGARRE